MTYTAEQIKAMNVQELAEATAVHVMGWQWQVPKMVGCALTLGYWWSLSLEEPVYHWSPAEDIADAWEVEEEINKLGKADDYGFELYLLTGACEKSAGRENLNVFKLAHATPAQRCKAALLAVLDL